MTLVIPFEVTSGTLYLQQHEVHDLPKGKPRGAQQSPKLVWVVKVQQERGRDGRRPGV